MNITQLQRFVAVVDAGLHVPRAAEALGIPLASLHSSIDRLEADTGHPLFTRSRGGWTLTPAGSLLLDEARRRISAAPAPAAKPVVPAGGKAKASKGKGRAPAVKGQPKPYKKRQGR
ncbi:LysR family transcriptional regulator [Microbacterium sp. HJ5]